MPITRSAVVKSLPRKKENLTVCNFFALRFYMPFSICVIWILAEFIAVMSHLNALEFVQIGSGNVWARTVIPALIIFHFSTIAFFRRHERGWNLKGKVWKPSLSLTFISYSKQMRESIRDESKSLALSLPLKVTRVINLHWRGSQILAWTLQDSPSHHLSAELLWIKRLSFNPLPPTPTPHYPRCLMSRVSGLAE